MPKLMIDNQRIEVAQGLKVIEAAEHLGIMIPRFCYHKALGSVGACRMCAVKFIEGPIKGIHMSCMVDAQDGMVVSTTAPDVVEFRKYVIELLMLNHPHDCPVCDEGGHCLLQDTTVSGGHGLRRYMGQKRTYRDQYLGHAVAHEMNRCIHCYRCVRFYQEFCGYRDFGALQIGSRVFFGSFADGPLESPFAGNLVDICPTGVFTDMTSRYRVRRWDLERGPSVCIHCSLGCNTIAGARYREVLRHEARFNENVNGYFICDRGRFGFQYESHEDRPRIARIDGVETDVQNAVEAAAQKIDDILTRFGPEAVACLGSSRNSLETQAMLHKFCRTKNISKLVYFIDQAMANKVKSAVSRLNTGLSISMKDIEKADFILALGVDAVNEAPMLTLAMRQAACKAAVVVVADPRPIDLPFEFEHFALPGESLKHFLFAFVKKAFTVEEYKKLDNRAQSFFANFPDGFLPEGFQMYCPYDERLKALAEKLQKSNNPVFICGTQIVDETLPEAVADAAEILFQTKTKAGLFFVFPGANSFGAALWDRSEKCCFDDIIVSIEQGKTRVLVVVENNPMFQYPDQRRLKEAIKRLDLFVVMDYLPSPTMRRADIFIPSKTVFESGGSFINQEGRIQYASPIHRGGVPVYQNSKGSHPERLYGLGVPGKDPEACWEILAEFSGKITGSPLAEVNVREMIASEHTFFSKLHKANYPLDNALVIPVRSQREPFSEMFQKTYTAPSNGLRFLVVDQTFGTEVLSAFSESTCKMEPLPFICMNSDDALAAKISEAKKVSIQLTGGSMEIQLVQKENMARGIIVLPRHRQLYWQKFKTFDEQVAFEDISIIE
ncbi:MAG: NADH-quinone oxidoreductase subunit NuoG [Desulfobacterales bacterium]